MDQTEKEALHSDSDEPSEVQSEELKNEKPNWMQEVDAVNTEKKRRKSIKEDINRRESKERSRRGSRMLSKSWNVIGYDHFKRCKEISFHLHRDRIDDDEGTMLWFEQIHFILVGKLSKFLKNNNGVVRNLPNENFFSLVTFNGDAYDFEVVNKGDRKDIVVKILCLSGYKNLEAVIRTFDIMQPADTLKMELRKKGLHSTSNRKSLMASLVDKVKRSSSMFRSMHRRESTDGIYDGVRHQSERPTALDDDDPEDNV